MYVSDKIKFERGLEGFSRRTKSCQRTIF